MQESNLDQIIPVDIEEEMRSAYIDYAMSVIVSRALPDVRDGLKPVHRRVLYSMSELGIAYNKAYKKSARIVGECLGKYHPHGDTSVYDTMVRMAQEWSMRYPMVDGQGNFGSMDGDSPAAMRYCVVGDTLIKTEKGLQRIDSLVPENQANTTYNLNTEVLSLHKQKHKTSQFFHSGFHKTYLLQTKEGFKIEGTANHPVLTIQTDDNGKPQYTWKLLADVKSDDKIIIERSQTQLNEKQASLKEKNLALVAGCLVSEGFITDKRLGFNNVDKVYFDNFIKAYKQSIDNEFFYVYDRKLKSGKTIYEFDVQNQKGLERFAQSEIYKGLVDRKASEKRIPDYIFILPKDAQRIFIQYLFEGDGSVSLLERNTVSIQYCSQSLALLEDLQTLLLEFGVIGKISKGSRKEYKLCIGAFHNITKFYENIGFATAKDDKLTNIVKTEQKRRETESIRYTLSQGFIPYIADYIRKYTSQGNQNIFVHKKNIDRFERIDTYKTQILHAINNEQLKYLFNYFVADRYYFATVESCELQAEEKAVYSVKVESDCHSFVANGFINHNTEARLKRISDELLADLNKETVDFQPNFDDSLKEPTVLPSKIPNLLVNGTTGIAVGMATVMAPHNLNEVVDGVIAFMENPDLTITDLIQYIPAPDFPTGAIIYGYQGVRKAFETGRGRVILRGKTDITTTKTGKVQIIATEIPYMINKATLIERTAQLVQDKRIEGISDIRDESDRKGLRIVYDLRKDAIPQVTLNQLYKYTSLQSSFSINNVALVDGRPRTLNLKDLIHYFVEHRHEVIYRRTEYELKQAKHRQHILEGLLVALDHLDEIIALIRASKDGETAKQGLMSNYDLSEIQAKAILDMRLQRLTAMERDKIVQEHKEVTALIAKLEAILAEKSLRADIIKEELLEMKERYGDERRSEIVYVADEFTDEDMIPREDMVVSISRQGYIKRTSLEEYRTQGRGGVGSRGTSKTEEDFTEHLFVASTHDYILIFTKSGQVFWKKTYHLPEVSKTSRGRNIQNVIQIDKDDSIQAVINVSNLGDADYVQNHFLIMCTENGQIKKTSLEAFSRPRQNGIRAITIQEGDNLLDVKLTNGDNDIILAVRSGRAIRFHESKVRSMGRTASGVRGITRDNDNDKVVGLVCVSRENANLLVVSENGYGKRSDIEDYRVTNRGGKGVTTLKITEKTGQLVSIKEVIDTDDLMIITSSGLVIRMAVEQMRVMGRATQGVKLIRLSESDSITSVAKVEQVEESPLAPEGGTTEESQNSLAPKGETEGEQDNEVKEEDEE